MVNDNISNFEHLKLAIMWIARLSFTASEYAVLIYLLDQQYNYIKNNEIKDGDFVGYGFMAKRLRFTKRQIIKTVHSLVSRHILLKEVGNKFGNHYHINENYYEWTS